MTKTNTRQCNHVQCSDCGSLVEWDSDSVDCDECGKTLCYNCIEENDEGRPLCSDCFEALHTPEPYERTPLIEAIIEEHCPKEFSEEALRAKTHNESEARFRRTGGSPERGLPSDRAYTGASGNQFDSDVPPDTSEPPSEALHTPDSSGEPPQFDQKDTDESEIEDRVNTKAHKERHAAPHKYLDELVADFITHGKKRLSQTTVLELIQWSTSQVENPDEE